MLAPGDGAQGHGVRPGETLGEHAAGGVDHLDRIVAVELAFHLRARRPAAANGRRRRGPCGRRRRRRFGPKSRARTRSRACGSESAERRGLHDGADDRARRWRRRTTPGSCGVGDHRPNARPRRDLGRRKLARHPAAPPRGARAPATASSAASTSTISSMSDAPASRRGSAVNTPDVSVSSTRRSAPTRWDDERGEPVVVAEPDLVVGDGVVLVDHGNDTEFEQARQRLARVEVLRALAEVVRREQYLPGDQVVRGEQGANRSISRGCPTAATACSVPMSRGPTRRTRALVSPLRSRPSSRARSGVPPHGRRRSPRRASRARRRRARPSSRVIDDVPTFTTTIMRTAMITRTPRRSRAPRRDPHDVTFARARPAAAPVRRPSAGTAPARTPPPRGW